MSKTIGSQVFDLRKNLRLSQEKFGEPLGISGSAVSSIEKGGGIRMETAKKIKEVYGVNLMETSEIKKVSEKETSSSFFQTAIEEMKSQVQEYREREKHYRETITQLLTQIDQQLGKPEGNSGAVVATKRSFWLQSGLHYVRMAS